MLDGKNRKSKNEPHDFNFLSGYSSSLVSLACELISLFTWFLKLLGTTGRTIIAAKETVSYMRHPEFVSPESR